jgi:hypothetical protein
MLGRTYEWFDMMGEFEGVREDLEEDGACKYCKRTHYMEWPSPVGQADDQQLMSVVSENVCK